MGPRDTDVVATLKDKDVVVILRIHTSTSAAEAEKYFTGLKNQEVLYYSSDGQEFAGDWGGKGAEMFGLRGQYTDEAFARLLNNLHPVTGEQLTPRMRDDRRSGFDLTFNLPKPVSIIYALTGDDRLIQATRQMVLDTMLDMERDAAARVRVNGQKDGDRKTGVLTWAEIIHLTARPVDGYSDPHVHQHIYVFNNTWDGMEAKWKALQLGLIKEKASHYNRIATQRLIENLEKLGLEIIRTKDSFDIAGISEEFKKKFSRRTEIIEAYAKEHGITDPVQKAKLGVLTRERKSESLKFSELQAIWRDQLLPEEQAAIDHIGSVLRMSRARELSGQLAGKQVEDAPTPSAAEPSKSSLGKKNDAWATDRFNPDNGQWAEPGPSLPAEEPGKTSLGRKGKDWIRQQAGNGKRISFNQATRPTPSVEHDVQVTGHDRRAVALAMEHVFERNSVVPDWKLVHQALDSFCVGRATLAGIRRVVAEAPLIRVERDGTTFVTTPEVLAEEKRLAARCIKGKDKFEPMNKFWKIEDEQLNSQQREAVTLVLNSRDWLMAIEGWAGVGKTKLLDELRRGIQAGLNQLIALAPTSEAARGVLRKEGFENAETVAKLLHSESFQKQAKGAVWLVDEAGLLSTREADRLLDLAAKLEARVVFVGDSQQHFAVQRGQAFAHLQKEGRMATAHVTEIQRQKGVYKRFVEHVLKGDLERAFMALDIMDAIFEMPAAERKIALAKDYVAAIERGETALVTAPTHAECRDVTEGIREELKKKQKLKDPREWETLRNLAWTDAQKCDCDQYKKGMVAEINGDVKGFTRGAQVEVIGVRDGMVRVRHHEYCMDKIKALPLSEPDKFAVYERQTLEICEGDSIRITGNGRNAEGHHLVYGTTHVVDYFSHDGKIVLENGWKLDRSFKHLQHGYALTSNAAQGKTVDWVFVSETAELSSCASDLRQFYVSTSRGRKGVKIYTDDIELLKENVSWQRERPMATEIMKERQSEERTKASAKEKPVPEQSSKAFGTEGPRIAEELAEILREYVQGSPERESEIETLSKHLGQKKEIDGIERALEMTSPIREREAAETARQMEEAEREAEWELER